MPPADEPRPPDAAASGDGVGSGDLPRWDRNADLAVVGRAHPRVEGTAKVTGGARYSSDIRLPGQLYARVLRCPYAHARLTGLDTSRAESLPGVHAVLSSANAPEIAWYEDGLVFDQILRFAGDEVAAVAAESEEIADDALRLMIDAYEPLPFALDLAAALAPDAPKLRPDGNLHGEPTVYARGDLAAGLRAADVVIDETYTTQAALHNCLEPHGCTAAWDGDRLTLWSSTQSVFDVRQRVAEALGVPEHHVRVIKQHMGGGFGSKQVAWKHDVIAALLARTSGRPVQLMLDREAENLATGNRNPTRQRVRLGATRDGTLTAIGLESAQQIGAHAVGGEGANVPGIYQTLYRCPNVRTEQAQVYTNTGPAVAFRAPGHVEGAFGLEQAMDQLARELGMDPIALRRRNYAETDQTEDKPYTLPEALGRCYDLVADAFGWETYRKPPANGPTRRGVGVAAHDWGGGGGHPPGYAWVKWNADGSVDVVTGTQDIGTGARTGLTQIAAEELGLPMAMVALHLGDTANGPYAPVSSGSATQATIGPAIRAAAADAKRQFFAAASQFLEAPPEAMTIRDGMIHVAGEPADRATPVGDVTARIAPEMIQGRGERGPNPEDKTVRTCGAQCVEVEVDTETGEISVCRVVTAHDCGRIVNPTLVDSQVIGGVTQGIGFALFEERVVDATTGVVLNPNLEDYHVPTAADVPPIRNVHLDLPDPEANPTGAKGIGEPPLIPTAPAIANAVYDAIGVRIRDLPLSRRRVLDALATREDRRG